MDDDEGTLFRIMTFHGSKGLEADTISVASLADEILPGIDEPIAANAAKLAEQRRLLYVTVTRAKKPFVLSRPKLMQYGIARNEKVRVDNGSVIQSRTPGPHRPPSIAFRPARNRFR